MKYNTAIEGEAEKAWDYLSRLSAKKHLVEVKKISPLRTLNQNSYIHLLIGLFALEQGWTLEEAKIIYKRYANPSIYIYMKNDEPFLKSSKDLSVDEMTKSIDNFRKFAAELGVDLPAAMTQEEMISLQNRLEQNQHYL